jgi:hypothetical protein
MNEPTIRHKGEFILVEFPGYLLCFADDEWSRAMRRDDLVLKNRSRDGNGKPKLDFASSEEV